jgi:hypothetical protein
MNKELRLLNLLCIIAAIFFLALIVFNAIAAGSISNMLSTDNLFVTMVCLLMALMFAVNPLLYLKSEGKLTIPFTKKQSATTPQIPGTTAPPMLDAKGRAMPPDVRAMVSQMGQAKTKDA